MKPILILSVPRSGTSWVTQSLGACPNAVPRSEWATQAWIQNTRKPIRLAMTDPVGLANDAALTDDVPLGYEEAWGRLQEALTPAPDPFVVVAKENNPFFLPWLESEGVTPDVHLVFLLRHPAGVAHSWDKRGWTAKFHDVYDELPRMMARAFQSARLCADRMGLGYREVWYEDLCMDPETEFRALCDDLGLLWTDNVRMTVRQLSSIRNKNQSGMFDVRRFSRGVAHRWRRKVAPEDADKAVGAWSAEGAPFDLERANPVPKPGKQKGGGK